MIVSAIISFLAGGGAVGWVLLRGPGVVMRRMRKLQLGDMCVALDACMNTVGSEARAYLFQRWEARWCLDCGNPLSAHPKPDPNGGAIAGEHPN
jgi:hypothetical protein